MIYLRIEERKQDKSRQHIQFYVEKIAAMKKKIRQVPESIEKERGEMEL